jgi:UDP-glucuronate 4-epimerase
VGREAIIVQEPPEPGDMPITHADITKARRLLNYDPAVSVREGMERFWAWYRKGFIEGQ